MKEQVEETEAVAESATAAPATMPLTQYGQVLALQRTVGNRAVAQMIAQGAVLARDTTKVEKSSARSRTAPTTRRGGPSSTSASTRTPRRRPAG